MVKITALLLKKLKKEPMVVLKSLDQHDIASIIQQANHSYFNTKTPLISDNLYDIIKEYLESINPNHPILKHVGSTVDADNKEELPYFLGSLDKIKSDENALDKFKKSYIGSYVVSDKLDGISALLYHKDGVTKMYSRGDGSIGQNVSHLIPFIKHIPECMKCMKKELSVRGELVISKEDFETVSDKGANARNMVSGLVNAKLPDLSLLRLVQFVAYEVISPNGTPVKQYETLKEAGFKIAWNVVVKNEDLNVNTLSDTLVKRRKLCEFEIDGIVVIHNEVHKRTEGNPKYGFAFKSVITMSKAEVTVTEVEWNMSKDGYLIPVVLFNPVALSGVTIKRAHGFNGKFIMDNVIGPGSKIVIMRSGDVIPYISEILSPSETGEAQMPTDVKYTWTDTHVDIMIHSSEKKESDELRFKNLDYFIKKIDIVGLSSGNLKKMYDSGLKTVKYVFLATKQDLLKVEGFKEKMAEKIANAIKERVNTLDCLTVMDASNTLGRGIGGKKIKLILDQLPRILKDRTIPTVDELLVIKGIEKKTANLFIQNLPEYFKFVDDNDIQCIFDKTPMVVPNIDQQSDKVQAIPVPTSPLFTGQKIVFTGFRNKELEAFIVERGGEVVGTVSKKTSLVVAKDVNEDSGKIQKAKDLGIKLISAESFAKKYNVSF
jgi:DNA ligase (NAD+)